MDEEALVLFDRPDNTKVKLSDLNTAIAKAYQTMQSNVQSKVWSTLGQDKKGKHVTTNKKLKDEEIAPILEAFGYLADGINDGSINLEFKGGRYLLHDSTGRAPEYDRSYQIAAYYILNAINNTSKYDPEAEKTEKEKDLDDFDTSIKKAIRTKLFGSEDPTDDLILSFYDLDKPDPKTKLRGTFDRYSKTNTAILSVIDDLLKGKIKYKELTEENNRNNALRLTDTLRRIGTDSLITENEYFDLNRIFGLDRKWYNTSDFIPDDTKKVEKDTEPPTEDSDTKTLITQTVGLVDGKLPKSLLPRYTLWLNTNFLKAPGTGNYVKYILMGPTAKNIYNSLVSKANYRNVQQLLYDRIQKGKFDTNSSLYKTIFGNSQLSDGAALAALELRIIDAHKIDFNSKDTKPIKIVHLLVNGKASRSNVVYIPGTRQFAIVDYNKNPDWHKARIAEFMKSIGLSDNSMDVPDGIWYDDSEVSSQKQGGILKAAAGATVSPFGTRNLGNTEWLTDMGKTNYLEDSSDKANWGSWYLLDNILDDSPSIIEDFDSLESAAEKLNIVEDSRKNLNFGSDYNTKGFSDFNTKFNDTGLNKYFLYDPARIDALGVSTYNRNGLLDLMHSKKYTSSKSPSKYLEFDTATGRWVVRADLGEDTPETGNETDGNTDGGNTDGKSGSNVGPATQNEPVKPTPPYWDPQWNVKLSDLNLLLLELATNDRTWQIARESLKPLLKIAPYGHLNSYDGYIQLQLAYNSAVEGLLKGKEQFLTSDADKNSALFLEYWDRLTKHMQLEKLASTLLARQDRKEALQQGLWNHQLSVSVANENMESINKTLREIADLDATHLKTELDNISAHARGEINSMQQKIDEEKVYNKELANLAINDISHDDVQAARNYMRKIMQDNPNTYNDPNTDAGAKYAKALKWLYDEIVRKQKILYEVNKNPLRYLSWNNSLYSTGYKPFDPSNFRWGGKLFRR